MELDMPYQCRAWDFHLTPVGWTRNDIPSAYTVETWRLSVYQEFAWSKKQYAWRRIWHNLAWSETERARFHETFPLPAQVQESSETAAQRFATSAERKRA